MVIDLTSLKEGETAWSASVSPEEIDLIHPDFGFTDKIRAQLVVTHVEQQYIIRGQLTTQAQAKCVRCLKSFSLPVDEHVDWIVQVVTDQTEEIGEDDAEDFWHIPAGTSELEIGDRVREIILVSLPTNPRCQADCRGLCPHCGADLNEEECECSDERIDPRWAALQDLVHQQKKDDASS